jgi:hypothetical protein
MTALERAICIPLSNSNLLHITKSVMSHISKDTRNNINALLLEGLSLEGVAENVMLATSQLATFISSVILTFHTLELVGQEC